MAVDFMILSGVRQGEQFRLGQQEISVGGESHCDIQFDVERAPEVSGKLARLISDEYGWCIRNEGVGDWFVNQDILPTAGASPLRSGDIIRLSELGPDIRFTIVRGEQFIVEEDCDSGDQSGNEETAHDDFDDEVDPIATDNIYTTMIPLLVLVLMILAAVVGTLLVMAD